jgi:valyl-tRNA synthetase
MDTWATSSLSPQVVSGWLEDPDLFARVFPMDLRPQGHDIIRTWLFTSVLRAHLEHDSLPWTNAALSGWVLDPDRKKMSKSKGNVVTPMGLLEEHGSDGVRYWAAQRPPGYRHRVRAGSDEGWPPPGDEGPQCRAIRADAGRAERSDHRGTRSRHADRAGIADRDATEQLDAYDYARVLERRELLLELLRRLSRSWSRRPATGDFGPRRRVANSAMLVRCRRCCRLVRRTCRS